MRLNQGLLHLAELRLHEQFSAAGNAEEDTGEDTCCCHRDPFGRAELGKYALNRVLHPQSWTQIGCECADIELRRSPVSEDELQHQLRRARAPI